MLSSMNCPALQYFYTTSNKRHDFWENVIGYKIMCFDFLYKVFLMYFPF
jgi:hypothetical protein